MPHPLQEQDIELWSDVYSGHPVLEVEDNACSASIDLVRWVPYTFHYEGIWLGTDVHKVACRILIAVVADICSDLIYSHDGGLLPELNRLRTEDFLIWCK